MSLPAANSGTIAITNGVGLKLGDHIGFVASGVGALKNPRVWASATQGMTTVWGAGCSPYETIKLGGDSSIWLHEGGPASCEVILYYILGEHGAEWNGRGAQAGTVRLAVANFQAAG